MKERTILREERGEITLRSLQNAAREAVIAFFMPARVLLWILAWPFRRRTGDLGARPQPSSRKSAQQSQG